MQASFPTLRPLAVFARMYKIYDSRQAAELIQRLPKRRTLAHRLELFAATPNGPRLR